MIILIDGYNVLKMVIAAAQVNDRARDAFIALLGRYARAAHHRITVVFDGGSDPRSITYHQQGVSIIYSGYRESADVVIKDLLEQQQKKEVLLVSTDRELNRYAEQFSIPSMDSIDFYRLVEDRLKHVKRDEGRRAAPVLAQKREGHVSSAELDALMTEGARTVLRKHADEIAGDEEQHKKASSKIDKRLERVVKKL